VEPVTNTRTPGLLHKVVDHLLGATREKDNATPSSARVYGGILFLADRHWNRTTPVPDQRHRCVPLSFMQYFRLS